MMIKRKLKLRLTGICLVLAMMVGLSVMSYALTVDMIADATTKTMPDGKVTPMWGFGLVADGIATVPGPAIVVPPGDTSLTINLTNNLPEPVSIVIPGQITVMTPVFFTDPQGRQRASSFTAATAPGATGIYTWTNLKPGTYLYHSGTHPSVQVEMGLYGALEIDAAANNVYGVGASAYDGEVTLLFSEIDPELHNAVATCNYGAGRTITSTIGYKPRYFLINGTPFSYGASPISPVPAVTAGQNILLRLINAGYRDYVPTLQGSYMTVIAEDGNLYPNSKQEYSVLLTAAKTKDAIITPSSAGYIPIYDRALNLTNKAASPGGALAFVNVPAATPRTLNVTQPGYSGTVAVTSAPAGIYCGREGIDCTETYNDGTPLTLTATPSPSKGTVSVAWTGAVPIPSFPNIATTTMNADTTVTAAFTFSKVTALAPNGGEKIPSGSTYTIEWAAPATAVKFDILLSLDNGATWTTLKYKIAGTPIGSSLTTTWKPKPLGNKKNCLIKVIGYSGGIQVGADKSDAPFTIEVVKLTSPNGGETITSGLTYCVHWTSNVTASPIAKVKLEYTKDGGTTWLLIAALKDPVYISEGLHSYDLWTVPTVGKAKSTKVRVTLLDSLGNILGRDASDDFFTIKPAQ
jgi:FtsP/CotA-like multicopper oxidase with cupredoxin domain